MADRPATTSKAKKPPKPGRKRRVAGWLLLVIGVLIAGVWGASRWWAPSYYLSDGWCQVLYGHFEWITDKSSPPLPRNTKWEIRRVLSEREFAFVEDRRRGVVNWARATGGWAVELGPAAWAQARDQQFGLIPLWPFALSSLLGGGWLVWSGRRARRRAMTGACRKCGYELSGLGAGAVCPECGTEALAPR